MISVHYLIFLSKSLLPSMCFLILGVAVIWCVRLVHLLCVCSSSLTSSPLKVWCKSWTWDSVKNCWTSFDATSWFQHPPVITSTGPSIDFIWAIASLNIYFLYFFADDIFTLIWFHCEIEVCIPRALPRCILHSVIIINVFFLVYTLWSIHLPNL